MIKLYHYSNRDIKGYIDPSFFGENSYSQNSRRLSGVKRSFFYLNKKDREVYFYGSQFRYTAIINRKKLYDFKIDQRGKILK